VLAQACSTRGTAEPQVRAHCEAVDLMVALARCLPRSDRKLCVAPGQLRGRAKVVAGPPRTVFPGSKNNVALCFSVMGRRSEDPAPPMVGLEVPAGRAGHHRARRRRGLFASVKETAGRCPAAAPIRGSALGELHVHNFQPSRTGNNSAVSVLSVPGTLRLDFKSAVKGLRFAGSIQSVAAAVRALVFGASLLVLLLSIRRDGGPGLGQSSVSSGSMYTFFPFPVVAAVSARRESAKNGE